MKLASANRPLDSARLKRVKTKTALHRGVAGTSADASRAKQGDKQSLPPARPLKQNNIALALTLALPI